MRNRSNSPSPYRSPSPAGYRNHSPSHEHYYEVPQRHVIFLALFVFLNIILFLVCVKNANFLIPFIISLICSFITYRKIDNAALLQVNQMRKSLSREQVSSILADKDSPFIDNHVRAKLIETTRYHVY